MQLGKSHIFPVLLFTFLLFLSSTKKKEKKQPDTQMKTEILQSDCVPSSQQKIFTTDPNSVHPICDPQCHNQLYCGYSL